MEKYVYNMVLREQLGIWGPKGLKSLKSRIGQAILISSITSCIIISYEIKITLQNSHSDLMLNPTYIIFCPLQLNNASYKQVSYSNLIIQSCHNALKWLQVIMHYITCNLLKWLQEQYINTSLWQCVCIVLIMFQNASKTSVAVLLDICIV